LNWGTLIWKIVEELFGKNTMKSSVEAAKILDNYEPNMNYQDWIRHEKNTLGKKSELFYEGGYSFQSRFSLVQSP
jgi:hypothetical protein